MFPIARSAFVTTEIDNFTAKGLRRCRLPGVGIKAERSALADFWRSPDGRVLIRCTGGGNRRSFSCTLRGGKSIPDLALQALGECASALLLSWATDHFEDFSDHLLVFGEHRVAEETRKGLKMPMTSEQGVEAAKRARSTATMANTLAKALAKRFERRWQFVDFLGPKGAESAGVVDLIAIRKDGRTPAVRGLKRLDLFDIILIQVKGGSAKSPTAEDKARLRKVCAHYGAGKIVLFEWSKQKKVGWSVLGEGDEWREASIPEIFGKS